MVTVTGAAGPDAIDRWRRYLADEHAEADVYRYLAARRSGEEREILLALAEAEGRHAAHWRELLAAHGAKDAAIPRGSLRTSGLAFLARHFGSVFVLALAQRAEARSPYATDEHATDTMAADERIHGEVVRGLAARGRSRLSGSFRAAVFGANDGLVSNLALILGVGAAGAPTKVVLLTGLAGLLAGALSMGAGEYVSVRSQRELLQATEPDPHARHVLPHLDVDANELALVYRARGMSAAAADERARQVLAGLRPWADDTASGGTGFVGADSDSAGTGNAGFGDPIEVPGSNDPTGTAADAPADGAPVLDRHETIGTAWRAAISSFCFFASGAVVPVLPYLLGAVGFWGQIIAAALVGVALLATGAVVGLLSGGPPLRRALRQLAIGYGAAAVTYLLGLAFGA
ncbi:MAG: rubrerythrin family protein [Actinobacteria bacterium 69-20]|nr:MAG: rubrerythrin family protein [Actinobacteria bacterium 69-20]